MKTYRTLKDGKEGADPDVTADSGGASDGETGKARTGKDGRGAKPGQGRPKKKAGKGTASRDKEAAESEEPQVKYSTLMWVAIIVLFFGALFFALSILLMNLVYVAVGALFTAAGLPLFFMEYRKMEKWEKRQVRRSALLLFRDVGIAFLIVVILLGSMILYSGTSPFMVVIESESMQHSNTESYIGVIDTGDLVLVRNSPAKADVITYVEGRGSGYMTYSDYGDVIVFRKNGAPPEETPIIHRAMIYLEWNETTNSSFDIPSLGGLKLNDDWGGVLTNGTPMYDVYDLSGSLWLSRVGYASRNFSISLSSLISTELTSGSHFDLYLTAGDHNIGGRGTNGPDPWYVKQEWIIGVARGEIPWFGLIKLTLSHEKSGCAQSWGDPCAPKNSWDSLLISIVLIVTVPFVLDFLIAYILTKRSEKKKKGGKGAGDTRTGKGGTGEKGTGDAGTGKGGTGEKRTGEGGTGETGTGEKDAGDTEKKQSAVVWKPGEAARPKEGGPPPKGGGKDTDEK